MGGKAGNLGGFGSRFGAQPGGGMTNGRPPMGVGTVGMQVPPMNGRHDFSNAQPMPMPGRGNEGMGSIMPANLPGRGNEGRFPTGGGNFLPGNPGMGGSSNPTYPVGGGLPQPMPMPGRGNEGQYPMGGGGAGVMSNPNSSFTPYDGPVTAFNRGGPMASPQVGGGLPPYNDATMTNQNPSFNPYNGPVSSPGRGVPMMPQSNPMGGRGLPIDPNAAQNGVLTNPNMGQPQMLNDPANPLTSRGQGFGYSSGLLGGRPNTFGRGR